MGFGAKGVSGGGGSSSRGFGEARGARFGGNSRVRVRVWIMDFGGEERREQRRERGTRHWILRASVMGGKN